MFSIQIAIKSRISIRMLQGLCAQPDVVDLPVAKLRSCTAELVELILRGNFPGNLCCYLRLESSNYHCLVTAGNRRPISRGR